MNGASNNNEANNNGLDQGRSQTQYFESIERDVPDNNSSLNQTPEILGGIDFNEINS